MKLSAACAFGLEAILKRELIALGYEPKVGQPGRVIFDGTWRDVCRANTFLRTADRVLILVQQFDAPDFDALFETIKAFDWSQFIPVDAEFPVIGKSRHSQLTSVPAVQRTVKKAIVESLLAHHNVKSLPESGAIYKVEIAILKDVATLSIDTTGPSLHKRGYRTWVGEAPLKETLAAALVDLSVWNSSRPLVDPFCGSGTIPIEAALAGLNIAPGINRDFACTKWPQIMQNQWLEARTEGRDKEKKEVVLEIFGFDIDENALQLARKHVAAAGVEKHIHLQRRPFVELRSKREFGCIVTNPPYGERLSDHKALMPLYQSMPMVLQRLPTWSHFILTSMPRFEKIVQKQATRRRKLFNARIECTYYQFLGPRPKPNALNPETKTPVVESFDATIDSAAPDNSSTTSAFENSKVNAAVFGGLQPKDHQQAELFKNRLVKRARHLRRWPTKRGITCFRLYERDIPELPFVVDCYGEFIHITEYERPHERDLARHSAWLDLMSQTVASALDVPIQKVFLKRRQKTSYRSAPAQYTKVSRSGKLYEVEEGGLKFLINLSDYVDTGLFLDHRNARALVRKESAGKRFLNLFAYTGSFTVYAADGGAAESTTVDLSRNYLQWAERNLRLNNLDGDDHEFVVMDAMSFIAKIKPKPTKYDLAIVDPPTYSNSKSTKDDWDVQTQHFLLLSNLAECMSANGVVYFSTNFRTFKLDEHLLQSIYDIREISKQTVPEDFRNKRIHRCWRLIKK